MEENRNEILENKLEKTLTETKTSSSENEKITKIEEICGKTRKGRREKTIQC